ncbi:hypothetical protein HN51_019837, partial [Arachis hypogaea]
MHASIFDKWWWRSKAWRGDVKRMMNPEEMKFYYDSLGFMSVQIHSTQIQVAFFYDVFGNVLRNRNNSKLNYYY